MKYAEINKRYTELVAEYMSKGYTINTSSMSGSQGEIAKIDLTDGEKVIRIMISTFHSYGMHTDKPCDGVEIIIGKSTDNVKPNSDNTWNTIWSNHLEVIHEEHFYKIDNYSDYYITSKEEARKAVEIRCERYRTFEADKYEPSAKAMEVAKRIVRDKLGYKRINPSEIKLSKNKSNEYVVSYKGKYYHLH